MVQLPPVSYTESIEGEPSDLVLNLGLADNADIRELLQKLLTDMYDVGRRFPFNLLRANWELHPKTLPLIEVYRNTATVDLAHADDKWLLWGVPIAVTDHVPPLQFRLSCSGKL